MLYKHKKIFLKLPVCLSKNGAECRLGEQGRPLKMVFSELISSPE